MIKECSLLASQTNTVATPRLAPLLLGTSLAGRLEPLGSYLEMEAKLPGGGAGSGGGLSMPVPDRFQRTPFAIRLKLKFRLVGVARQK